MYINEVSMKFKLELIYTWYRKKSNFKNSIERLRLSRKHNGKWIQKKPYDILNLVSVYRIVFYGEITKISTETKNICQSFRAFSFNGIVKTLLN